MSECPFPLCRANVIMVVEQAQSDDDELTVTRVPIHVVGGYESFGTCPASLMSVPIDAGEASHLRRARESFERIIREQRAAKPVTDADDKRQRRHGEHSKTPHPDPDASWFQRGTNAGGRPQRNDGLTSNPRPVLQFTPTPMRGNMASIEEVKAMIDVAAVAIAEAQAAAHTAVSGKLAEALELLNVARTGSVDDLGAIAVRHAIELADEISRLCARAIEAGATWKSGA